MDKLVKLPCGCLYGAKDQKVFSASPNCKEHHAGQEVVFNKDFLNALFGSDVFGGDISMSDVEKILDGFK